MGGTTMVMALVLPEQHCSLLDAYENCRALADAKACCDYALHVGVTWWGPKVRPAEGSRFQGVPGPMNGLETLPLIFFKKRHHSLQFHPSMFYLYRMNNKAAKPLYWCNV